MDVQTAATTAPQQPQQDCPLMKLPTELRIRIYKFATEHLMDTLYAQSTTRSGTTLQDHAFYSAVLALPHTSRTLRAESLDTLEHLVLARLEQLSNELYDFVSRPQSLIAEDPRAFMKELVERFRGTVRRSDTVRRSSYVCCRMGWAWEEERRW
jgi:hypothetical protein